MVTLPVERVPVFLGGKADWAHNKGVLEILALKGPTRTVYQGGEAESVTSQLVAEEWKGPGTWVKKSEGLLLGRSTAAQEGRERRSGSEMSQL